jgi:hypothetical protein
MTSNTMLEFSLASADKLMAGAGFLLKLVSRAGDDPSIFTIKAKSGVRCYTFRF